MKKKRLISFMVFCSLSLSLLASVNNSIAMKQNNPPQSMEAIQSETQKYYLKDENGNDIEDRWFEYYYKDMFHAGNRYTALVIPKFSENFGNELTIPNWEIDDVAVMDYSNIIKVTLTNRINKIWFLYNGQDDLSGDKKNNIKCLVVGDNYNSNKDISYKNYNMKKLTESPMNNLEEYGVLPDCKTYMVIETVLYSSDKKRLVDCPTANPNVKKFIVNDDVEYIEEYAFNDVDVLKKVFIGNNVKKIGRYAFANTNSLGKVVFNNGVKTIGNYAFSNSDSLKKVVIGDNVKKIGKYAFANTDSLEKVILGKNVRWIREAAFSGAEKLHTIKFNKKLKTLSDASFANTKKLKRIVIPKSVKHMNGSVFLGSGLKKVVFKCSKLKAHFNDTELYEEDWFSGCKDLKTAILCDGMKRIPKHAFYNCISLRKLVIPGSVKKVARWACEGCPGPLTVYAPKGSAGHDFAKYHKHIKNHKIKFKATKV